MNALHPGDVVRVGPPCSVQFSGDRVLRLRLVAVADPDPYNDWVWLMGYVLDLKGNATDKREVYVQRAGIVVTERSPRPMQAIRKPPTQPRPKPTPARTVGAR